MTQLSAIVLLLGVPLAAAANSEVCPNGQNGTCGTTTGLACPAGTTCRLTGVSPDGGGKCCIETDTIKTLDGCAQPLNIGPCKAAFRRYFYNSVTGQCESFFWGGCDANDNNYRSKEQCKTACENVCSQPRAKGSCKDRIQQWYFDTAKCKCKKFVYSGCGGNANRFISKQDCEGSCGDSTCSVCSEPKKAGPCKAAKGRFYYNTKTNKCQKFVWGGCKPNGNNFVSLKACEKVCKRFICSLPLKVGPCLDSKKRYYYDVAKKSCKKFLWGGCESNGNNFSTRKACKTYCM